MFNSICGLTLAFVAGSILGSSITSIKSANRYLEAIEPMQQAQAKCEQALPRNQTCGWMFVPQPVK